MRRSHRRGSALWLSAAFLAASLSLAGCQGGDSEKDGLTPVTLSEVAHSIFYAQIGRAHV